MKGLVKYRVKSNNKKAPNTTKSTLNFIAVEFFHMLQKTDQILNMWPGNLTGHNKIFLRVKVKKEAKEGGRG